MKDCMTWLTITTFSKKVWSLCKKYWQLLLGAAIPIVIWLLTRNSDSLKEVLANTNNRYKREIDIIEDAHQREIESRAASVTRYQLAISQIEKEYENRSEELSNQKLKAVKAILKENSNNPEDITKKISELTGITIHISE